MTRQTELYFHTTGPQEGTYFQRSTGTATFRLPEAIFTREDGEWGMALTQLYMDPSTILNLPTPYSMTYGRTHRLWPAAHYGTASALLRDLQGDLPPGVHFDILDEAAGKFQVGLESGGRLNLSENIARVLGLPATVPNGTKNAGTDVFTEVPFVTVACTSLKPLIVNDSYVRSLKSIALGSFPDTQPLQLFFHHPTFVPLLEGELASITLRFITRQKGSVAFSDTAQVGLALALKRAPF